MESDCELFETDRTAGLVDAKGYLIVEKKDNKTRARKQVLHEWPKKRVRRQGRVDLLWPVHLRDIVGGDAVNTAGVGAGGETGRNSGERRALWQ